MNKYMRYQMRKVNSVGVIQVSNILDTAPVDWLKGSAGGKWFELAQV